MAKRRLSNSSILNNFRPECLRLYKTPEAVAYQHARQRCNCVTSTSYKNYGGRGIEFRFDSFADFLEEVGERPSPKHSLDRIDNNGHYEKGNVRWATRKEQHRNQRTNHLLTYNGETLTVIEWSERLGCAKSGRLNGRLKSGWCTPCTLTLPSANGRYVGCPHKNSKRVDQIEAIENENI